MHHVAWFLLTLAVANCYGLFLRKRIGFVEKPLMTWVSALLISLAFVSASLAVAYGGLTIQRDAGIALIAILTFVTSWLGLRYWLSGTVWDATAVMAALALTFWFFSDTTPFNAGIMLIVASLGASVGGYYATKAFLRISFLVICAYDVYAVWLSNTMATLMRMRPDGLFSLSLMDQIEIGTLDVMLAAVAIVGIQRHRGVLRSSTFGLGCFASILLLGELAVQWPIAFARVPYVIVLAPLTWLFLVPRRHQEQSS